MDFDNPIRSLSPGSASLQHMSNNDLEFNKNEDQFKQVVSQLRIREKKTRAGGGEKKIDEQHQKGKLTARERVSYLIDKNSDFLEIGLFAGDGMYKEVGGCPSAGSGR